MNGFGREFVIDYNHADHFARKSGGEAPAAGWMKRFYVKDNGAFYAEVEWTGKAQEAINQKEYKYISPTLFHSESGEITGFSGAALVNFPSLTMEALCSSMGLPTPAINSGGDNALAGEIAMLRAELNAVNHERLERRRHAAVEAIRRNHLPMLLLDDLESRCAASGVDEMDSYADALGRTSCSISALAGMQTETLGIRQVQRGPELTDAEKEVCRNLGLDPGEYLKRKQENNED